MEAWTDLENYEGRVRKSQSAQVNGPTSGRDDIGPDLLQRYDVTGLGGLDGEEPRDGNSEKCKW
jgi:hypothetical protein